MSRTDNTQLWQETARNCRSLVLVARRSRGRLSGGQGCDVHVPSPECTSPVSLGPCRVGDPRDTHARRFLKAPLKSRNQRQPKAPFGRGSAPNSGTFLHPERPSTTAAFAAATLPGILPAGAAHCASQRGQDHPVTTDTQFHHLTLVSPLHYSAVLYGFLYHDVLRRASYLLTSDS